MTPFQFCQLPGVDEGIEVKFDSQLGEHFNFAQALDQGQFVLRDSVGVQAAGQRVGVINRGSNAAAAQLCGAGERGGAGADQGYGQAGVRCRGEGQRGTARVQRIHGEALQARDLNRLFVIAVHDAGAFT